MLLGRRLLLAGAALGAVSRASAQCIVSPNDLNLPPLCGQAQTNFVRNPTMAGAVIGGALPTNWSSTFATTTVAAFDTTLATIDLRLQASGAGNFVVSFDGTNNIASVSGQVWTLSVSEALIAGTLTNVTTAQVNLGWYDAVPAIISQIQAVFVPTATMARPAVTATTTGATAWVRPQLRFVCAGVTDFTLRIGRPRLETY